MNFDNLAFSKHLSDKGLYAQEGFLDVEECEYIASLIENYRQEHQVPHIYRRRSDRSLDYKVIDGEAVARCLPDIEKLYQTVNKLINQAISRDLAPLADKRVGCNVNITQPGGEYRWHYDRNLMTGILYLNDAGGGETECYPNYRIKIENPRLSFLQKSLDSLLQLRMARLLFGKKILVTPRQGKLVLMYGNRCLHSVRPVSGDVDRITLIFSYDFSHTRFNIGQHLDAYLYEGQQRFNSSTDPNYKQGTRG